MKHCPNPACPHIATYQVVSEYEDVATVCSECSSPLVAGNRPEIVEGPVELVEVYASHDAYRVDLAKGMLENAGIVGSETISGASGMLPFEATVLHVPSEQAEFARTILAEFDATPPAAPDWHCHKCGTLVPGTFEECWRCAGAAPPDAEADPNWR